MNTVMENKKEYKSFDEIDVSTMTIVATTNWKIDIKSLFEYLETTPYTVTPKKRGRKPKNLKEEPVKEIKEGSVVTMIYKDKMKGVFLKEKKAEKKSNYFRNSLTIVIFIKGKMINAKISENGKFQITGCKTEQHAEECIKFIWSYIQTINSLHKINICKYTGKPECIFVIYMTNMDFEIGFKINRQALDQYINENTMHDSILETSFGYPGVNIKMKLNRNKNPTIKKIYLDSETFLWKNTEISYEDYTSTLQQKDKKKDLKERQHTFLVFQSGNVILSSKHIIYMKEVYEEFMSTVFSARNIIEETLC